MNVLPIMEWWYGGAWVMILPVIALALVAGLIAHFWNRKDNHK